MIIILQTRIPFYLVRRRNDIFVNKLLCFELNRSSSVFWLKTFSLYKKKRNKKKREKHTWKYARVCAHIPAMIIWFGKINLERNLRNLNPGILHIALSALVHTLYTPLSVYTNKCAHMCTRARVCEYVYVSMYLYTRPHIYVHTYVRPSGCIHAYTRVCAAARVGMHVCTYVCSYTYHRVFVQRWHFCRNLWCCSGYQISWLWRYLWRC